MTDFRAWARDQLERAGIDTATTVEDADLAMLELLYGAFTPGLSILDGLDPEAFPFEPIDPSRAP